MPIEAILWDQDGLLVDTERLYYKATKTVLRASGVELDRAGFARLFLKSSHGIQSIAEEQGWTSTKLELVREARHRLYSRLLAAHTRPMPWARTVVRRLSTRFRMVVVTSSYRHHVELINRKSGLLKYMEFVVADGDFANSKPHPDPYLIAMERLGLPPSRCVAIEDSERGLAAARAARLRCIVVPNALTRGGQFKGAWRVLGSLKDLCEALGVTTREGSSPRGRPGARGA